MVDGLVCRECGARYPAGPRYVCEACFGPLEVTYRWDHLRDLGPDGLRARITAGPPTLWRYGDFLPGFGETPPVDLGTGFTPLLPAPRLGERLGLRRLYLKNDAVNPTYSFKDRVVSVAVGAARAFGFDTVACASTGNLAASLAAHAARAGLECYIFVPADLERAKLLGTAVYNPTLVAVDGTYDEVNRLAVEVQDRFGWAFVNVNLRAFYSEGSKTLGYETAEQLGWRAPDHVVVPIAGGSVITKIHKGLKEWEALGLIERVATRVSGAQAAGCAPVANAFKSGARWITPVRPDTIARSLAIGNPADGPFALELIRSTGGQAEVATDAEIVEGIRLLAETEGIFTETAGGVTVAVLKKLAESGRIGRDELTVAYITGNGYKTLEALEPAAAGGRSPGDGWLAIEPSLEAFEAALSGGRRKTA